MPRTLNNFSPFTFRFYLHYSRPALTIHPMPFTQFFQTLTNHPSTPTLTNPYQTAQNPHNVQRLQNLHHYLEQMQVLSPKLLLVGEAPGYRGCRLTGIPFVSNVLLAEGFQSNLLFGESAGYVPIAEWEAVRREASATIMWQTIGQLTAVPLLWNACPFHPHKPNTPQSNRAPKTTELACGRPFLQALLSLFPIQTVVAVGNKADFALTRWGIAHQKVRHPSFGGKRPFQSQLLKIDQNITA